MNFVLIVVVFGLALNGYYAEAKVNELQVRVVRRVDNCRLKSKNGDVLHVHYTGKLEDGKVFDSSVERNEPFKMSLGSGQVIQGWEQGLLDMCETEKRQLTIPSHLGYGERGSRSGRVPGGATMIFDVELLKIERKTEL